MSCSIFLRTPLRCVCSPYKSGESKADSVRFGLGGTGGGDGEGGTGDSPIGDEMGEEDLDSLVEVVRMDNGDSER